MPYKTRPGVVLTKICDDNVLIPSRAASEHCRLLQRLSPIWAMTWSMMEKEKDVEQIIRVHQILTRRSTEQITRDFGIFCDEMTKKGFLIPKDPDQP